MTLKEIIARQPESLLARAYRFAEQAHAGQKRKSGEPYINHPLAAAQTLLEWQLDETSVAAGLLHDVAEDTDRTLEDIRREFGDEIAFLVDGVTKLGRIKYRGVEARVENLRKMLLALSEDLRVVFIKLADRLHNMKTLGALPPQKQKRIALETDEIYAPIAYRLGMQNLAGELHDLAFPYIHPQEDRWLNTTVKEKYTERQKYLEKIQPVLQEALAAQGLVPLATDFRAKRRSSLYQKLLRHNMDLEKIYDLVAMRIIVDNVAECYNMLGVIHQLWPPLPGRIKDYIALPKPNGYRSLHTTVIGPDGKFVEIQIRTRQMHDENENGIAAHWVYEQNRAKHPGGRVKTGQELAEEIQWVQQLRRWQEKFAELDTEEFLKSMKIDFFRDRIFAITPHGDVIDLPQGSTPVDFAYAIHSEIGNTCVGAKVNDSLAPLNHQLQSGDVVQIVTQKGKKPSEDWLEFVKTANARDHIRSALRKKGAGASFLQSSRAPTKAELRIVVEDRVGLIKDISSAIARSHVNIVSFTAYNPKGSKFPVDKVEVGVTDKQKLEKLVLKLKNIKGVREISYQLV
jgi:GTP diphosphokinase / guanosine-3',5'-bis(diphosphate) 3'-diphosphatase